MAKGQKMGGDNGRPVKSGSVGSRVIRDSDTGEFLAAASKWGASNTQSQSAARAKLRDMGIIGSDGRLTGNYKSKG